METLSFTGLCWFSIVCCEMETPAMAEPTNLKFSTDSNDFSRSRNVETPNSPPPKQSIYEIWAIKICRLEDKAKAQERESCLHFFE